MTMNNNCDRRRMPRISDRGAALRWYRRLLSIGVALALCSPMASASNLEEIVVTARKKAESLQDSPISITALSGDRLEEMGLTRVTRLQDVTPNLVFQNTPTFSGVGNNAAVYIRGIGPVSYTHLRAHET